jgi:hypothetical protein
MPCMWTATQGCAIKVGEAHDDLDGTNSQSLLCLKRQPFADALHRIP